jgi:micrococcal nuclease
MAAKLTARATVLRIIDGDTFAANIPLGWGAGLVNVRVRLNKINAPEAGTEAGDAATDYIKGLVSVGDVLILTSSGALGTLDNYGRVLADVALPDGRDWGTVMLESGHAVSMAFRHAIMVSEG